MSISADGWVDGFAREPGANDNFRAGRVVRHPSEWCCPLHFTAGRCAGDRSVGLRGYFNAYAPRERGCGPGRTQFARIPSITWSACEFNPYGVSIEFERLSWNEELTDYQIESGALWINSLIELGVPDQHHYDGRVEAGTVTGFINHGSCRQYACEQHSDGITHAEYLAMRALGAPPPTPTTLGVDVNIMYVLQVGPKQGWVLYDGTSYLWADDTLMAEHRVSEKVAPALYTERLVNNGATAAKIAALADKMP